MPTLEEYLAAHPDKTAEDWAETFLAATSDQVSESFEELLSALTNASTLLQALAAFRNARQTISGVITDRARARAILAGGD